MDQGFSDAIAGFDGECFDDLAAALDRGAPTADALAGFVVLVEVGDANAQIAASWLLFRCLEKHYPLLPNERRRLVAVLADESRPWEVRFHLCRSVRWLRTPPDVAHAAAAALEQLLDDEHRRVRCAAVDGLDGLAKRFPALDARAEAAVQKALHDKAPSVRAEARVIERRRAGGS